LLERGNAQELLRLCCQGTGRNRPAGSDRLKLYLVGVGKLAAHEVEDVFYQLKAIADSGDDPGRTGADVFSREPDGRDDRSGNDRI